MKKIKLKKAVIGIVGAFLIFLSITPFSAYGAEEETDYMAEITEELEDILSDYDIGFEMEDLTDLSFQKILSGVWRSVSARLEAPVGILAALFLVIVFNSLASSAGITAEKNSANMYNMVCVMAAVTVTVPQLMAVYGEILQTIRVTGSFILVFVPVLTAASIAAGGFTTAGVYHIMMLGASEIIVKLSESYLLPILGATAALGVTGSVFPSTSLESFINLIKKLITWGISITMTLFTGFVSLKCTITGKADGAVAKTAKMLVSGCVPIVGGAVSDAYSTVRGSFDVIGGTVGAAGIVAIVILLLPGIIEILVYRAVMWIGSAAADVFSAASLSKLLKSIDSGLAIAQSVLVCYSIMFILCSAILMKTFGG